MDTKKIINALNKVNYKGDRREEFVRRIAKDNNALSAEKLKALLLLSDFGLRESDKYVERIALSTSSAMISNCLTNMRMAI